MSLKISEVANFYSNKSVFVTGGSGFVGQVLIEKLLYSCKEIDKIYILIRPKKHLTPAERMANFFESNLYSKLKSERPEALSKLRPIEGELSMPNLGLSSECKNILIENVSVVFHVAATVRFDEPIRVALTINVEGTLQLLELSKEFKKLEAFIHVSTAYSNITRRCIEERVYDPKISLDEVYQFIKKNDSEEEIRGLLGKHPNTYTFTKGLAEYEVKMTRDSVPVAIVRPSIVSPIYKDPIEGWLSGWNGPTTLLYLASRGIHRCQMGNGDNVADLIPVDIVSNMIIVAATACSKTKELKVYNCVSGPRNPIVWDKLIDHFMAAAVDRGFNDFPFPRLMLFGSRFVMRMLTFFLLTLPCFLIDFWRRIFGLPPKYMKLKSRITAQEVLLNFATLGQWDFEDGNVRALIASMSPEDQELFYCDPSMIDWKKCITNYYLGIRKHLLKL